LVWPFEDEKRRDRNDSGNMEGRKNTGGKARYFISAGEIASC
jgi:hypothetical protein